MLADRLEAGRVSFGVDCSCCGDGGCNDRMGGREGSDGTEPFCKTRIKSAFISATSFRISLTVCSFRLDTSARSCLNLMKKRNKCDLSITLIYN